MNTSDDKNPSICHIFDREKASGKNNPPPETNPNFANGQDPPPDQETQREETTQENLEHESREHFKRYLQDRSVFPAPMRREAYYGIAGKIVALMAEHCEASPESLLFQFLVAAGNVIGRSAYVYAGGPWLFPNEFAICVGSTARGRKGTAWRMNEHLFHQVAPEWLDQCTGSDIQSGEGIIHRIRDEVMGFARIDRRRRSSEQSPQECLLDPGVSDKRLLDIEEEISNILKMAHRTGNTLTEIFRKSWDSPRKLRNSNKNSPLVVTDPHISLIGHTNKEELLLTLADVELSNGFANRILWCASERQQLKPHAQHLDWRQHPNLVAHLKDVFKQRFANTDDPFQFKRTNQADSLWKELYLKLNDQKHVGFIDGVLVRDTSHLLKLALIYAILDQVDYIDTVHLQAALALCDYSQATARWLFAERTGNKLANTIFWALCRNPEGMTRDMIIDDVCYRNTPKIQLDQALESLSKNDMVRMELIKIKKGRKIEKWLPKF